MSDVPIVHTGQPLVPLSDDEIADRAGLPSWTLTEALFWLGGYRSPGYESDRHMQDHFWSAYTQAVGAIELGDLCRKIKRAGKTVFIDRPKNWLVWADKIGPKHIKVDERMRRALSQTDGNTAGGTVKEEPQPVASKATTVRPNRRGRKKGIGGYDSKDMPLIEEMHRLIEMEEVTGRWNAALKVVDKAPGTGGIDSKLKRLAQKYGAKYGSGEGHSD